MTNDAVSSTSFVPSGMVTSMRTRVFHGQFWRTVKLKSEAAPAERAPSRHADEAMLKIDLIFFSRPYLIMNAVPRFSSSRSHVQNSVPSKESAAETSPFTPPNETFGERTP